MVGIVNKVYTRDESLKRLRKKRRAAWRKRYMWLESSLPSHQASLFARGQSVSGHVVQSKTCFLPVRFGHVIGVN